MTAAEMQIAGMGPRADRALVLADRTSRARDAATEALRAAGLAGRAWWAAKDAERWPERAFRLMLAAGVWDSAVVALDAAGVEYRRVEVPDA